MDRLRESVLPPVVILLVAVSIWQLGTIFTGIPAFVVPSPIRVTQAAWRTLPQLAAASWLTARAALCGLAASILVGTFVAFAFSQSRFLRRGCYPYAIFLQTVPIVAIAPLVILWFDRGFHSIVIISFAISLFPVITNTTTGLLSTDRDLLDLFRLNRATRLQTLLRLRLPSALPYLFAGIRIACGGAVVGAIVGEFFVGYGVTPGLGALIRHKSERLNLADELFAAVIASTLLGVCIFALVSAVGDAVLKHRE